MHTSLTSKYGAKRQDTKISEIIVVCSKLLVLIISIHIHLLGAHVRAVSLPLSPASTVSFSVVVI